MTASLDELKDRLRDLRQGRLSNTDVVMIELCSRAVAAGLNGNYPAASALVSVDGRLSFESANESFRPRVASARHAEMLTLDDFEASGEPKSDLHLFITLEPCLMCMARISLSAVRRVTYLTSDPSSGPISCRTVVPPDFAARFAALDVRQATASAEVHQIGKELYEVGERLWTALSR